MSLITGFRAFVCRSSAAAVELATTNPQKHFAFAEKLLLAKNTSNAIWLNEVKASFEGYKLNQGELATVKTILRGSMGSSPGADRGAADLLNRYQDHVQGKRLITALEQKQEKYDGLAQKLSEVGGRSLHLPSTIKDPDFWSSARSQKQVTWADQQSSKARELISPGNWDQPLAKSS